MKHLKILAGAPVLLVLLFAISHSIREKPTAEYAQRSVAPSKEAASLDYLRQGPDGRPTAEYRAEAFTQIGHRASRASSLNLEYRFRGPDNVGGRTRAMLEMHGDPNRLLVGSVTGGLFFSNNGGATWEPHEQFQNLDNSSSLISCIAQDTNNGAIYIGTGSSYDSPGTNLVAMPGYGIYKSTDGGKTFEHLSSTTPENRLSYGLLWTAVNRIAIGPESEIYAATHSGLWMSLDGGETWENPVFNSSGSGEKIVFTCSDVATTPSGRVIAAYDFGEIYISEDGTEGSFIGMKDKALPALGASSRVCLAASGTDENIIYAAFTEKNEKSLLGVYKTANGGDNWSLLLAPHDEFSPYCASQCQGDYDAALAVSPADPNTIFIGGVEIWRYDGSLERVANEFGAAPFLDVLPFYVHADKHFIYFSPNDPQRMYVTTDGGVTKTEDNGTTWQGLNKLYGTTQFYGIAYASNEGQVIGGTQDNGTLALLGDNDISPNTAVEVNGGDGLDCDISQVSGVYFATSQYGALVRAEAEFPAAVLSEEDGSPFWTVVRLWENTNDKSSKDSIVFANDDSEQVIAVGNGSVRSYQEQIVPTQEAAKVIRGSVKVISGNQILDNSEDAEILSGSGTGSVSFREDGTFDVLVNFEKAPTDNENVVVQYSTRYDANDILNIESDNFRTNLTTFTFEHRLESQLNPGERITVQDPVQSLLAKTSDNGLGFYRGVLNLQELPTIMMVPGISGTVSCIEFTSDGNVAFAGVDNRLIRISGLNELYVQQDMSKLQITDMYTAGFGQITGISIDPQDDERFVFTIGRYGSSENVIEVTNAMDGLGTQRVIHGDLPAIPVYDAEIDRSNPDIILLGTEFGVWATSDAAASGVAWTDENNELSYVPVYDIRQQKRSFEEAPNSGVYYIGTYGRGIWETGTLIGIGEFADFADSKPHLSDVTVFPNPLTNSGTIEFQANESGVVKHRIMNLQGRMIREWEYRAASGMNQSRFDASEIPSGAYFITLDANGTRATQKFLIVH